MAAPGAAAPAEQQRITLRVMRLNQPGVLAADGGVGPELSSALSTGVEDAASAGVGNLSGALVLPRGFGSIFAGQEFRCHIVALNDAMAPIRHVRLSAELQFGEGQLGRNEKLGDFRSDMRVDGDGARFSDMLLHGGRLDLAVACPLRHTGKYTLRVAVRFTTAEGAPSQYRKFYSFNAMDPFTLTPVTPGPVLNRRVLSQRHPGAPTEAPALHLQLASAINTTCTVVGVQWLPAAGITVHPSGVLGLEAAVTAASPAAPTVTAAAAAGGSAGGSSAAGSAVMARPMDADPLATPLSPPAAGDATADGAGGGGGGGGGRFISLTLGPRDAVSMLVPLCLDPVGTTHQAAASSLLALRAAAAGTSAPATPPRAAGVAVDAGSAPSTPSRLTRVAITKGGAEAGRLQVSWRGPFGSAGVWQSGVVVIPTDTLAKAQYWSERDGARGDAERSQAVARLVRVTLPPRSVLGEPTRLGVHFTVPRACLGDDAGGEARVTIVPQPEAPVLRDGMLAPVMLHASAHASSPDAGSGDIVEMDASVDVLVVGGAGESLGESIVPVVVARAGDAAAGPTAIVVELATRASPAHDWVPCAWESSTGEPFVAEPMSVASATR